jgi:peptide/nickel transport system substrate-binding protein
VQHFRRRILYFAWLLTALLLLPACSSDKNHTDDPPGNILRIDLDYDFGPFNPHAVDCSGSTYVFPFIYSFLCVPNPEGKLEPDLAVAWNYNFKTFTWRIKLRKDARFHNGDSVTAADAAYSISAIIKNYRKGLAQNLKSIKVIEEHLLEIRLEQDDSSFLGTIWDMEIVPDPNNHTKLDLNHSPVGSGPFQFVERTDDGQVILSANETYYNGRPAIDRIVFYYIPQREDSWGRLIRGDTDIVGNLSVKDYEIIKQYEDRFYFVKNPYHSSIVYYSILLYNTHQPLFENPMVRQALTHAINREYIVQKMLNGMAEVVAGPMGNRPPFHDPDLKPLDYDPYLALEYLNKAGWTIDPDTQCLMNAGRVFEFNLLLTEGSETDLRVARFIKLNLNEVGIRVRLKALPVDAINERYYRNTEFDAVITELTASSRRPEAILGLWLKRGEKLSKAGGFDSPEATRLGNLILGTKDLETRIALLQRFDVLMANLHPGSFLFQKIHIDAMSKRFALNLPFSFDYPGFYKLQHARLKNE